MTRVVPGQLWCEARNVDTCAFRTVRWLIVVRVDGDRVSTVDVDHDGSGESTVDDRTTSTGLWACAATD